MKQPHPTTIQFLKECVWQKWNPRCFLADNEPQLFSSEFRRLAPEWEFKHVTNMVTWRVECRGNRQVFVHASRDGKIHGWQYWTTLLNLLVQRDLCQGYDFPYLALLIFRLF